jgi:hypothetical protein
LISNVEVDMQVAWAVKRRWLEWAFDAPDRVTAAGVEVGVAVLAAGLVGLGGTRLTLGLLVVGAWLALAWRDEPVGRRGIAKIVSFIRAFVVVVALAAGRVGCASN